MDYLLSNWKVTFDPAGSPLVLLAYNDKIDAELVPSLKRALQVTQLDEGTAPFLRPAGNNVVNFTIKVYTDESLDATARRMILESLIAIVPLGKKPLRIEIAGITGTFWQFANCFITDHSPTRQIESVKARLCKSYSITATGLSRTGP